MDDLIKAAMPALLAHPEAREKVLAYLQALVDEKQPKEEWREVWWQISEDIRRYNGDDIYTSKKYPNVRLFLVARYSNAGAGVISATHVSEAFSPNNMWYQPNDWYRGSFHKEVVTADHYVDVIIAAQKAWADIHAKWVAETLPLEDHDALS